jgi:hypothetical protein
MVRKLCFLLCVLGASPAHRGENAYIAEPLPSSITNELTFGAISVVSSNWLMLASSSSTSPPYRAVLMARPIPSEGRPFQQIAVDPNTGAFGYNAVEIFGDSLIVKDSDDTYFFRLQNGQWLQDGDKIAGKYRLSSYGQIAIKSDFLLSGSEVYQWPSRQFVQELAPPVWNAVFVGRKLAVSSHLDTDPGVWLWQNVGGVWTNRQRLPEPPGVEGSRFGLSLAQCRGFLLVAAPHDNAGAPGSGAVHVYMSDAGGDTFFYHQKLKPALPMANDHFGAIVTVDGDRVYVSAPYRNEEQYQSGAIFVYQLRINRASIAFAQIAKVTLKEDARAEDWLAGLQMKVRNGIIYTQTTQRSGRGITMFAFHPPIELTPWRYSQTFGVIVMGANDGSATWESTTNLNTDWKMGTSVDPDTRLEAPMDQAARFFRIRTPSAF